MRLVPVALPDAAEAVTILEFEEVTALADKGPIKLFSDCMSLSSEVTSVWIVVKALLWLCSVDCCDSHAVSGASAALTAALTAEVTSMPELDDPVAASRIELRSIDDELFDEDRSELNTEDVLIRSPVAFLGAL